MSRRTYTPDQLVIASYIGFLLVILIPLILAALKGTS